MAQKLPPMDKRVSEDWQFFNAAVMLKGLVSLAERSAQATVAIGQALATAHAAMPVTPAHPTTAPPHASPPPGPPPFGTSAFGPSSYGQPGFHQSPFSAPPVGQPSFGAMPGDAMHRGPMPDGPMYGSPGAGFTSGPPNWTESPGAAAAPSPKTWPPFPATAPYAGHGQAPVSAPPAPLRWLKRIMIGVLLILVGMWYVMLTRPQETPLQQLSAGRPLPQKEDYLAPGNGRAPLPPRGAEGSVFVTLHRNAYEHGDVTTFWFFESQEASLPVKQSCVFFLPASPDGLAASERRRSFEIEQRPGGRQTNPGYMATGLTLTEWNQAAEVCRWHDGAQPSRRPEAPSRHPEAPLSRRT